MTSTAGITSFSVSRLPAIETNFTESNTTPMQ